LEFLTFTLKVDKRRVTLYSLISVLSKSLSELVRMDVAMSPFIYYLEDETTVHMTAYYSYDGLLFIWRFTIHMTAYCSYDGFNLSPKGREWLPKQVVGGFPINSKE